MMQNLVCTAFLAAALGAAPPAEVTAEAPQPVSETTTTPPTEPLRKLLSQWLKCKYASGKSSCLAAGCFFIKLSHFGLNDVCEPKDTRPRQQKDAWSKEESPCLNVFDQRLGGHTIDFGTPGNLVTKADCERYCKAQPGATACSWDEDWWGEREKGDAPWNGATLGTCKYFTDSEVYDCKSVWFDDEQTDDPCSDHYESNTEWCMVFGAKVGGVRAGSATKCTGELFKNKFNRDRSGTFTGVKVFGCGNKNNNKHAQCQLGCKPGYRLANDTGKAKGKKGKKGTRSDKFFAGCRDGVVWHGQIPDCRQ